jgi:hypothetical protein
MDNRNATKICFIFNQDIVRGNGFTVPELGESPEMIRLHTKNLSPLLIKNEIQT